MKRLLTLIILVFAFFISFSQKDNTLNYPLPDSVKAGSFLVDISVLPIVTNKEISIGIKTDVVKLSLEAHKKEREIVFEFPPGSTVMATGIAIKKEKDEFSWKYKWTEKENYKLMIATAGDSAGNFALYSGYVFLPKEKKWKLIGTCKISGQWNTINQPAVFTSRTRTLQIKINEVWCQRRNGSWKNLSENKDPLPIVNLYSHVDSLEQLSGDKKYIEYALQTSGRFHRDSLLYKEHNGIYYAKMKEGAGRQVSVNDTVTAFYKGYLFGDLSVFDETKDKPATFPLKRLIMGWQIGVPLCKIGGKIKIIIPSDLAYSIRTRAAKIPPNSILVFEIEVVDAKAQAN